MAETPPEHSPEPPYPARLSVAADVRRRRRRSALGDILAVVFLWSPFVLLLAIAFFWSIQNLNFPVSEYDRQFFAVLTYMALPLAIVSGGTLFLLFATAAVRSISSTRTERARAVLGYLENAIRLNLPLDRFLMAAEISESFRRRSRIAALRSALQQGMPVGTALQVAVPDVLPEVARSLEAAENIGQLQPSLTRLIARDTRQATSEPQTTPFYRFYFPLMLVAIFMTACFLLVFIAPKFRDIFKDFHTTLPPLTARFFELGNLIDSDLVLPAIGIFLLILLLLALGRSIQMTVQVLTRTPRLPFLLNMNLRWIPWYVPGWRQLLRDESLGGVMEFLGDALRAGLPLPQALDASLTLVMPQGLRRRMERWLDAMLAGKAPGTAAAEAKLPRLIVGFLDTSLRAGNTTADSGAEVFDFLARYYRERFSRMTILLRAVAEPAAVLVMGILVGTMVLSMFLPMAKLINAVMGSADRGFL